MKKTKETINYGIDIGTHSVKLVKLKVSEEKAELLAFDAEPLQLDLSVVLKKIRERHSGMDALNIAASGQSSVIRYIDFPHMNIAELKQALKFEAQKYITFLNNEVNLDAAILKDNLPDNKMFVLLAAVKKDWLGLRMRSIEAAGLRVSTVDIDSLALVNAFNFNYASDEQLKNKAIALLNIGAAVTNLSILDGGIPQLSRDIQTAGNTFTQKLADLLHIDSKAAEALKLVPDPANEAKMTAVRESLIANLFAEVRTSFDYYESQHPLSIAKIFLSGGGSKFPGIKDALAGFLGTEIEPWDPFKNITLAPNINAEKLKDFAPQLAVAAGLALRR